MTVKIDKELLDGLTEQEKASVRLRMNLDLRTSGENSSQMMLNAIEPGSVVPIHRHRFTSETFVVLRGSVVEEFYSSSGEVEVSFEVAAGGEVCALNIPAGEWHTLRALESGTVILEMKDGAYEPIGEEDIMRL